MKIFLTDLPGYVKKWPGCYTDLPGCYISPVNSDQIIIFTIDTVVLLRELNTFIQLCQHYGTRFPLRNTAI